MAKTKRLAFAPRRDALVYVGIDPSITATGIIVLRAGQTAIDYQDTIVTPSSANLFERICHIDARVHEVLKQYCSPGLVAIETPFVGRAGGDTSHMLSALAFRLRALMYPGDYLNVTPSQLKKFTTGRGGAQKDVMLKTVWRRWNYDTDDNNRADAYALARVAQAWCEGPHTQYEADALQTIADGHAKSIWSK